MRNFFIIFFLFSLIELEAQQTLSETLNRFNDEATTVEEKTAILAEILRDTYRSPGALATLSETDNKRIIETEFFNGSESNRFLAFSILLFLKDTDSLKLLFEQSLDDPSTQIRKSALREIENRRIYSDHIKRKTLSILRDKNEVSLLVSAGNIAMDIAPNEAKIILIENVASENKIIRRAAARNLVKAESVPSSFAANLSQALSYEIEILEKEEQIKEYLPKPRPRNYGAQTKLAIANIGAILRRIR